MAENIRFSEITDPNNEKLREYLQYSFFPEQGSDPDDWNPIPLLENDAITPYGMYAGETLRTVILEVTSRVRIRDEWHDVGLLSHTATPPEYRRSGTLYEGFRKIFESYRERGYDFCMGRTFKHGFYTQFGVETVSTLAKWECSPQTLLSAVDRPTGTYHRFSFDQLSALNRVHRQFAEQYSLSLDRGEDFWRALLDPYDATPHIAGWKQNGELEGYVVYSFQDGTNGTVLRELDMAYTSPEAYRHLLYYMGNHDSQVNNVVFFGPEETSPYDMVDRPGQLTCTVDPCAILRVVDVERALEAVSYPADVAGQVTFRVTDDTASWNDQTFSLSVAEGRGSCERIEDDPEVTIDIRTLAQLVTGYRSVETLAEVGHHLTIHDEGAGRFLSDAFPTETVYLRDEI